MCCEMTKILASECVSITCFIGELRFPEQTAVKVTQLQPCVSVSPLTDSRQLTFRRECRSIIRHRVPSQDSDLLLVPWVSCYMRRIAQLFKINSSINLSKV